MLNIGYIQEGSHYFVGESFRLSPTISSKFHPLKDYFLYFT